MIIVGVIGYNARNLLLLRLNRSRQTRKGSHHAIDLLLIEAVQLL